MASKKENPTVKILVAYHKPSQLLKNDIFVPIHLGRALATQASKDGAISTEDYQWMLDNMIGDDTGENISELNRHFCELTSMYWAWKNYDKLGTPDYIGFCHYRRFLNFEKNIPEKKIDNGIIYETTNNPDLMRPYNEKSEFTEELKNFDIIHGSLINHHLSVSEQFTELENPEFGLKADVFDKIMDYIPKKFPEFEDAVTLYKKSKRHYWYNCFIMKKEIFMEYCAFLFPILLKFEKEIDYNSLNINGQRILAYISERLLGFFITKKELEQKKIDYRPIVFIKNTEIQRSVMPAFNKNNIPVILSSDDNYVPYLAVCLKSLIENTSKSNNYDICILENNLSLENKNELKKMQTAHVSIRFVSVTHLLEEIGTYLFHLCNHFSIATYYRFFIPRLFKAYKKILYLDCDIVVLDDVAKLYHTDLKGNYIGAVQDVEICRAIFTDKYYRSHWTSYLKKTLKMENIEGYFQAGVMVFDIDKLLQYNFEEKCLKFLSKVTPKYVDQCIMNNVLQGHVLYLDFNWNVEWQLPLYVKIEQQLPLPLFLKYSDSRKNPKIIHYAGEVKPWKNPTLPLSKYWWHYARQSSFYEEILYKNLLSSKECAVSGDMDMLKKCSRYFSYYFKYLRYRIMSKITFGRKRKKYKQKKQALKREIKQMKKYLKT